MKSLEIFPEKIDIDHPWVTRKCRVERRNGKNIASSDTLFFQFNQIKNLPEEEDAEAYLIALIFLGMAEGRTINVHGNVSESLLSNLTEFRDAWNSVAPDIYKRIDFFAKDTRDIIYKVTDASAVAAFTGGVDSTFSIIRHVHKNCGYANKEIRNAVFVHGFDIPLENSIDYNKAFQIAKNTLDPFNIKLNLLKTNLRKINWVNWEHQVGNAVVACLQNYKANHSHAVVAATLHYGNLKFQLGSNAISDSLLSSPSLNVIHDGAAFSRVQKLSMIYNDKTAYDNLRVCWENPMKSENCSTCEKCIRTILCMRANNIPVSQAFSYNEKQIIDFLKNVIVLKEFAKLEFEEVLKTAVRGQISDEWVHILAEKLPEVRNLEYKNLKTTGQDSKQDGALSRLLFFIEKLIN